MDKLITIREAADALGISERTVRRMIDRNELRAYKIGRCVRLREGDVQDYIESGVILRYPTVSAPKLDYKPGDKLI